MNTKFILSLIVSVLISCCTITYAYNSDDLNKRLISCTPTKDYATGSSTLYQISGLTGSICIYKIQNIGLSNKPDLICKVPFARMREMTSANPIQVQKLRNQYCVISIKSFDKSRKL